MITEKQLIEEIAATEKRIELDTKEFNELPAGHLITQKRKNSIQYTRVIESKRTGISSDKDLQRKLARKEFLKKRESILQSNLWHLKQFQKHYQSNPDAKAIENMRASLQQIPGEYFLRDSSLPMIRPKYKNEIYRILGWNDDTLASPTAGNPTAGNPFVLTTKAVWELSKIEEGRELLKRPEIREYWGKCKYPEYQGYQESKNKPTPHGFVRSKSEQMIVSQLNSERIPFHYEEELPKEWGLEWLVPDFIYISLFGQLIFHEHFGMMNDSDYREGYYKKLAQYQKAGILPWKNLIITFDTSEGVYDPALVITQIKAMLGYQL